jgi:hypothetical protein
MNRIRKFALRGLLVLVVLAAAGFALRHPAGDLLVLTVMGPFDPSKSPPPPDYTLPESWAALPSKTDPSDRLPEGLQDGQSAAREHVDVFYIHPTGFDRRDNWNGTVGEEASHGIPTSVMLAGQASAFNGCGQVYAPAYRQASIFAYAQPLVAPRRNEGYRALDLAYSDVARAFDHFIEHFSKGRPFIIASHSQGSVHALRLLAEKVDARPCIRAWSRPMWWAVPCQWTTSTVSIGISSLAPAPARPVASSHGTRCAKAPGYQHWGCITIRTVGNAPRANPPSRSIR